MLRRTIQRRCAAAAPSARPILFTVGAPAVHGFVCTEVREVPELNLVGYRLEHERTKATYFHFDVPDTNNAFCLGFRTPAPNNKGTTHVLEHTVLCGSEKYPVRDPFFMMIRRTLSNYMNALTGADYTLYPFATTNPTDYSNLLSVYLDATLRPLLRAEDFLQEGHRLELAKDEATGLETSKVQHNGVVYNEMKGVVSDPARFFSQKLQEKALPGTHYEYISGGNPPHILDMTHEELVAFHKAHYHPSNSVVMTYGSMDPRAGAMPQINEYFAAYEPSEPVAIPRLERYHTSEMVLETTGPLDLFGNPAAQKRVAVATALPAEIDTADTLVKMSVLSELLTSGPSSPMYKSLIESKIGTKYAPNTGYSYYLSTPMLSFGLEGIDESRAGAGAEVAAIIEDTLATVAKEGFDERRVEAVVFQEMLQQKHRDANYGIGIVTGLAAMALVKPHQNVLHFLNTVPALREIQKDHKAELLPLIGKAFTENKHKVRLVVSPDAKFIERSNAPIEASEAKLTAEMSDEAKAELSKTTAAWLERVRAPTDGSCLPSLTAADVPRKGFVQPHPVEVGRRLFHLPYATNGLVYIHGFIPLSKATAASLLAAKKGGEEDPTVLRNSLLHSFCGRTGAGGLDYKDLSVAFDSCMSGFSLTPTLDNTQVNSREFAAGASFSFYTVKEKVEEAMALVGKVLHEPVTDRAAISNRIDVLTTSRASSLARAVQHQGNTYAILRAAAAASAPMRLKEARGGITQVDYATRLLSMTPADKAAYIDETVGHYGAFTSELRARAANALVYFTCEQHDAKAVTETLSKFQQSFASASSSSAVETHGDWLVFEKDTPLIETASERIPLKLDTSFAAAILPHDHCFSSAEMQKLRVACKLLSNEFLHRKIREEGGAYGASCTGNLLGTALGIGFSSYRDPTPEKSLAAFAESPHWLTDSANITAERLEQAKLTLFATIDAPISPDVFGYEFLLNKLTPELNQSVRDGILSVTREDVQSVAEYFSFEARRASTVCITPADKGAAADGAVDMGEGDDEGEGIDGADE